MVVENKSGAAGNIGAAEVARAPADGHTALLTLFSIVTSNPHLYPGNRYQGEIILQPSGVDILSPQVDPMEMRLRTGMVFQKPNPFPKSIFENVAYGLRLRFVRQRQEIVSV